MNQYDYLTSNIFITTFFQLQCVTYDHDGRCCGGLLYTFLTQNREESEKLCNSTIDDLIRTTLEPLLQNINHQSSYEAILSVIEEIEDKYWSKAIGPAAGDIFSKFHKVRCGSLVALVGLILI